MNPWHQEEEERDTNHHEQNRQTHEKHIEQLSLFHRRGDRKAKRTEEHKDKT